MSYRCAGLKERRKSSLQVLGQGELVTDVAPSVAEQGGVDCQHQSLEAGFLGAAYEAEGDASVEIDVQLEPLDGTRGRLGHFLDAARRYRREYEHRLGCLHRCERDFSISRSLPEGSQILTSGIGTLAVGVRHPLHGRRGHAKGH